MDPVECAKHIVALQLKVADAPTFGEASQRMVAVYDAFEAFYRLGAAARPGADWLLQTLRDTAQPDAARAGAMEVLRESEFRTEATPAILEALEDPVPHVRGTAAASVRFLGREAIARALPTIQQMASADPDEDVQRRANKALRRITDAP